LQCLDFLEGAGLDEEQALIPLEQFIKTMIMLAVLPFMERLRHSTPLLPELKVKLEDPNSCGPIQMGFCTMQEIR
jgi:hypothetical protein